MEKSRKPIFIQFGKRLLTLAFLVMSAKLFALEVIPQSESAIVGNQTIYILDLPDTDPSSVEFSTPELSEEASIALSKKSPYLYENGTTGTRIEFYVLFFQDGYFQLPNLQVKIDDLKYSIPFQPLQVFQNPATIQPELFCEFTKGVEGDFTATEGKAIEFTVFARFFHQVVSYSYDIPENALFRELETFPSVKANSAKREFSSNKVALARFEWIPLVSGETKLPAVKLSFTTYSGAKAELSLDASKTIFVKKSEQKTESASKKEETDSLFAYAFTPTGDEDEESEIAEPVSTEIRVLSRLRDKERRSLPFSNTRNVRRQVESAMGLVPGEDEPYIAVPLMLWIFALLTLFLAVLFLRKKRNAHAFSLFFALVALIAFAVVFTARQIVPYGVFTGGEVYTIPEKSSKTSFYIHGGNRVRIMERTPGWLYIAFNNVEGWVPVEMVEPIKSTVFEIEK